MKDMNRRGFVTGALSLAATTKAIPQTRDQIADQIDDYIQGYVRSPLGRITLEQFVPEYLSNRRNPAQLRNQLVDFQRVLENHQNNQYRNSANRLDASICLLGNLTVLARAHVQGQINAGQPVTQQTINYANSMSRYYQQVEPHSSLNSSRQCASLYRRLLRSPNV